MCDQSRNQFSSEYGIRSGSRCEGDWNPHFLGPHPNPRLRLVTSPIINFWAHKDNGRSPRRGASTRVRFASPLPMMYALVNPFLPKVIWPWVLPERRTYVLEDVRTKKTASGFCSPGAVCALRFTFFDVVSAVPPTLSSNESFAVIFRDRQVKLSGRRCRPDETCQKC